MTDSPQILWEYLTDAGWVTATITGTVATTSGTVVTISGASTAVVAGVTIKLDNEELVVVSKDGLSVTVTRAANGTTAAVHAGATVYVPSYTLYNLVGKRVYSPDTPGTWANTSKAITYEVIDESDARHGGWQEIAVQFYCYGGDANATTGPRDSSARQVYRALYDRLHGAHGVTASGTLHVAVQSNATLGYEEPETQWPVAIATYQAITGGT